ncbi:MAG: cytochrome b N-terminal domain-containing protein [Candidatus Promineifilaceae bacterium]|jgi:quinol-cytochrome oxidoreductase complex cytochrome b subunit
MNLTRKTQDFLKDSLTLEDALPTQMPVYVNSTSYLFGVSALSALFMLILTGIVMSLFGPGWYHVSKIGRFFNSLHFWSVQILFMAIVLHMVTKYMMAAWRDGRWKSWMVGMIIFFASAFTGLTGFLIQTNWDSQWIAVQAKDAINAAGAGSFFNPLNLSQVLTLHVVVLPLAVTALVVLHLFYIRRDSPVKPLAE